MRSLLLAALLMAPLAHAEDPEFLLSDYGVRIDLPGDWNMLEWGTWDFKAEKKDKSLKLYAWGDYYQLAPAKEDLEALAKVFTKKAKSIGGKDPRVSASSVETIGGRTVARIDVDFDFPGNLKGTLAGGTFAVEGQMFHMGIIASSKRASLAKSTMDGLLKRLEVNKPPKDFSGEQKVSANGVETVLPAGWHAPHAKEMEAVNQAARKLGVDKELENCWTAIQPVAAAKPDVMISCAGMMLLGVVDEYSFEGVDGELRPKLFGGAEVPPAQKLDVNDGAGFLYNPADGLRMAVVPYDKGVSRTWAMGREGDALTEAVRTAVTNATWSGPHPTGPMDQVSYYMAYRPTSPMVLGPAALLLGLLGFIGVKASGGGKDKYADLD